MKLFRQRLNCWGGDEEECEVGRRTLKMERYKAKVLATASVELIVKLEESINGDIELDEVLEVLEVDT